MAYTYWSKQTPDKPLFPDLLWSRPEQKTAAGKLLIVGGNLHSFVAPAQAFNFADAAGIGLTRVLLPDAIKKLVGDMFETADFASSTPSGSFGQKALADLLEQAEWADGVLLAGDFGRNSETAILLEKFLDKYEGRVTLVQDSIDYVLSLPGILQQSNILLAVNLSQLQKLAVSVNFETAFTSNMDLLRFVEALHIFTELYKASIVVKHLDQMVVAVGGNISTTPAISSNDWQLKTAAYASVWWLQNPSKPFEALTTAVGNISFTE